MTKKEAIRAVAKRTGYRIVDIQSVVDSFIDVIRETAESGETVKVMGLATFETINLKATKRHNPVLGELVEVPARKRFKASVSSLWKVPN